MLKKRKLPRIFFGWWIVTAGAVLAFWGHGYYYYGLSALFKPISSELGFSRAVTSVAASIGQLGGGIEGPLAGWFTDRFGPRWIVLAGICLAGLGFVLTSFVDSLWSFYLAWGVVTATGIQLGTSLPLEKAISNWFVRKRGLAISIRWTVAGLCVVSVMPLVAWLTTVYGWRLTVVVGGIVMWLIGLPMAWFMVKPQRPEYYGLLPDGVPAREEVTDTGEMIGRGVEYAAEADEVEFTLRQAMKTPAYWLLIIANVGQSMVAMVIIIHSLPFLTDMGIDPVRAAWIVGTISLLSIVTRFIIGFVADRVRRNHLRFIMAGAYLMIAAGITAFLLDQSVTMVYVFYSLYYAAFGVTLPLNSLLRSRYFGRKAFGSIQGVSMMLMAPVGIIAPIYAGWVYDTTGSYTSAFTVLTGLITLAAFLLLLARPPKPPAEVSDIHKFW